MTRKAIPVTKKLARAQKRVIRSGPHTITIEGPENSSDSDLVRRLRGTLLAACVDLQTPHQKAHALKTFAHLAAELDPRADGMRAVLFGLADVLRKEDFAALEKKEKSNGRSRSVEAWARTRRKTKEGTPVENFLAKLERHFAEWRENPARILDSAVSMGALPIEDWEKASARLKKALSNDDPDAKTSERTWAIAVAVLGSKGKLGSIARLNRRAGGAP